MATAGGEMRAASLGSAAGGAGAARRAGVALRAAPRLARVATRVAGSLVLACTSVVFALITFGPRVADVETLTVLSSSMRPALDPGDIVISMPAPASSVSVGDVITFRAPVDDHPVVTHRVIEVVEPGAQPVVRTKGDANDAPDAWLATLNGDVVWKVRASVPYLGWVLSATHGPAGRWFGAVVAPALLAVVAAIELRPRRPRLLALPRALVPYLQAATAVTSVVVLVIGSATVARAAWSDGAASAATYSSATLQPPTSPSAAAGTCIVGVRDGITLSWTATPSAWADGYEVARSTVSGGPYATIGTVSGQGTTSYSDPSLSFSTAYHYVVRATKGGWRSTDTVQTSRTTRSALCV